MVELSDVTGVLTTANNKYSFYDLAEAELTRTHYYGRPISVAYISFDGFNSITELHGKETIDQFLEVVIATLRGNTRKFDTIARVGRGEFIGLFPESLLEPADAAMKRTLRHLSLEVEKRRWPLAISIGVVTFSVALPSTVSEMIAAAEYLMLQARKQGRNRVASKYYSKGIPIDRTG